MYEYVQIYNNSCVLARHLIFRRRYAEKFTCQLGLVQSVVGDRLTPPTKIIAH